MTQQQLPPHGNIAPPTEPFTTLDDTVHDTAKDVVLRSRRRTRRRIAAAAVAAAVVVAGALFMLLRPDQPKAQGMTPDTAVSFVQDEYPGVFPDPAKLKLLFQATCGVLDAGGTRADAIVPLIQSGQTADQATYILDMSIYSSCPQYKAG